MAIGLALRSYYYLPSVLGDRANRLRIHNIAT